MCTPHSTPTLMPLNSSSCSSPNMTCNKRFQKELLLYDQKLDIHTLTMSFAWKISANPSLTVIQNPVFATILSVIELETLKTDTTPKCNFREMNWEEFNEALTATIPTYTPIVTNLIFQVTTCCLTKPYSLPSSSMSHSQTLTQAQNGDGPTN